MSSCFWVGNQQILSNVVGKSKNDNQGPTDLETNEA